MGLCASVRHERGDQMEKILFFVKYAHAGNVEKVLAMLQEDKISPNAQDRFGLTALHWAAYGGKLECISTLLANGASPLIVDHNGRNALHHACRKDHEETVRYLITQVKIDVNSRSESKDTPLHKAVLGKSIKSIEVLLELGADPHLRNDQNRTPLEELDVEFGTVRDTAPDPLQIEKELSRLQNDAVTEVSAPGFPSMKYGVPDGKTMITSFRSRLSECSDPGSHSSSPRQCRDTKSSSNGPTPRSVTSRPSAVLAAVASSNLNWMSERSAGDLNNLHSLGMGESFDKVHYHTKPFGPKSTWGSKRSLKYAGKRVIMTLRVKKIMSADEKRQMIRLLLQKRMQPLNESDPNHIQYIEKREN